MTIAISMLAPACHNIKLAQPLRRSVQNRLYESKPARMKPPLAPAAVEDMPALLAAVGRDRDVAAFEVLFRYYGPRVRSYMARLARDNQAAEELMQETMMAVWNKADQFDPARGNVSTWIFTIARNLRVDAFRKARRPDFDPNDPAFVPDDSPPADVELDERQEANRLYVAMAVLPLEQRELIKRAFFDDVSHSVIAADLGLPLGTVKSRIRLAFGKLRAALGDR